MQLIGAYLVDPISEVFKWPPVLGPLLWHALCIGIVMSVCNVTYVIFKYSEQHIPK